jgi:hypothetical protein
VKIGGGGKEDQEDEWQNEEARKEEKGRKEGEGGGGRRLFLLTLAQVQVYCKGKAILEPPLSFSSIPAKAQHKKHRRARHQEPQEEEEELDVSEPLLSEEDKKKFAALLLRMEGCRQALREIDPTRTEEEGEEALKAFVKRAEEQVEEFMVVEFTEWTEIAEWPLPKVRQKNLILFSWLPFFF